MPSTPHPTPFPDRETAKADRIELILRELDALPTLSAVAVRLLELTADEDVDANAVIELVSSDPALASKVLALCRCHERGRTSNVTTVERAVLLLGFEAVRCAVLAVHVFELIEGVRGGELERERQPVFDRESFWLHSLAVAVASERIAHHGALTKGIRPSEAFIAGLLHDIGQLVLHVLLPESFDQVCRVAETHGASLDHACRQIIGIDSHTTGKRLAEHFGLPSTLVDVIWLNGQPLEALPPVPHRGLISVVTLADALMRCRYITPGAHWSRNEDVAALCVPVGISSDDLDDLTADLHDEVISRAAAMGLSQAHDTTLLLRSLCRANESLARANAGMRQREVVAQRQARTLKALADFYTSLPEGASVLDVLGCMAKSSATALGGPLVGAVYESVGGDGWRFVQLTSEGHAFGNCLVTPPAGSIPVGTLIRDFREAAPARALMPWLSAYLMGDEDRLETLRMLPLPGAARGDSAILLLAIGSEELERGGVASGMLQAWQTAMQAGAQHDRASLLAEQLAEANRTLIDTRDTLARSKTLCTLGEVASGAAHEMNNPLAIISGRAQLLAHRIQNTDLREMAIEIQTQSHHLSDMISALRSFAEPIEPSIRAVDLANLVMRAVQARGAAERRHPQVNTVFSEPLPPAHLDPDLIGQALGELVRNALEAKGSRHIELRVQTDPLDGRLRIEVRDDGEGMSEHTLEHAFDPFFSDKPAGRQPGLGLARARRFVEAHGGRITLANGPSGGAIGTIWLKDWRDPPSATEPSGSEERRDDAAHGGRDPHPGETRKRGKAAA